MAWRMRRFRTNASRILISHRSTVFFLKHLYHAARIRDRILECFDEGSVSRSIRGRKEGSPAFCCGRRRRDVVRICY